MAESRKRLALSAGPADDLVAASLRLTEAIVTSVQRQSKGTADINVFEDDTEADVKEWLPTGFPNLDKVFGGGWPISRISEVFGPEQSGKSALLDMGIVEVHRAGGFAVIEEFENTREKRRLLAMGADLRRIAFHRPRHVEEAWENIWRVIGSLESSHATAKEKGKVPPPPVLIGWDSIGGAPTQREFNGEEGRPYDLARIFTSNCRRLFGRIRNVRAHVMFVNQVRTKMGGFGQFGVKEYVTPGGEQVKHASTVRVRMRSYSPRTLRDEAGIKSGLLCYTEAVKNKIVPPYRPAAWILDFEGGPSPVKTALFLLKKLNVVKASSLGAGQYHCPWKKIFREADWPALMADAEFAAAAWEAINSRPMPKLFGTDKKEDEE